MTPQPDWPPSASAVGLPDGERRRGSTGQLFVVKDGVWERVLTSEDVPLTVVRQEE